MSSKCDTCISCIAEYEHETDPTPITYCIGYFCGEDMEENFDTAGGCYLYEERDIYDEDPFECYEREVE